MRGQISLDFLISLLMMAAAIGAIVAAQSQMRPIFDGSGMGLAAQSRVGLAASMCSRKLWDRDFSFPPGGNLVGCNATLNGKGPGGD